MMDKRTLLFILLMLVAGCSVSVKQIDETKSAPAVAKAECGNGIIEEGEFCDKNTIDCQIIKIFDGEEITKNGSTVCRRDCRGYEPCA